MSIEKYDETDLVQERLSKVGRLLMQGRSELAIARELGIKRVEVLNYAEQWREQLRRDSASQDRAMDQLNQMVKHYDELIRRSYKLLENLDTLEFNDKIANQINAVHKTIGEFDKVRVDLLQKAGLLEGAELGDELAEMERKQKILIDILRNDLCSECQKRVARRLQEVTNVVEAVIVHDSHGDNV